VPSGEAVQDEQNGSNKYESELGEFYGCQEDWGEEEVWGEEEGDEGLPHEEDEESEELYRKFVALLQSAKKGDHICFTFSGHGYYTADMYDKDEADGYDELIVTADHQTIVDDEFKRLIQTHLKEDVTLFSLFDNCHSGTIYDLRYQYLDSSIPTKESMSVQSNPNVLDTRGQVIMLSGCMDNQVSLDARINGKFNGVMTWCFLEALRESKYTDTWETLLQRIRTILNVNKLQQIPQMSSGIPLDTKQKVII